MRVHACGNVVAAASWSVRVAVSKACFLVPTLLLAQRPPKRALSFQPARYGHQGHQELARPKVFHRRLHLDTFSLQTPISMQKLLMIQLVLLGRALAGTTATPSSPAC